MACENLISQYYEKWAEVEKLDGEVWEQFGDLMIIGAAAAAACAAAETGIALAACAVAIAAYVEAYDDYRDKVAEYDAAKTALSALVDRLNNCLQEHKNITENTNGDTVEYEEWNQSDHESDPDAGFDPDDYDLEASDEDFAHSQ